MNTSIPPVSYIFGVRTFSVVKLGNHYWSQKWSTHVFNMDRDFSKIKADQSLADSVGEVVRRLQTFKVAVHPRIRLLYALLRRAMARHAQRRSDSLYVPQVYRATNSKET